LDPDLLNRVLMNEQSNLSGLRRIFQRLRRTVDTVEAHPTPEAGRPGFEEWLLAYRRRLEEICEGTGRVAISPGKTNR